MNNPDINIDSGLGVIREALEKGIEAVMNARDNFPSCDKDSYYDQEIEYLKKAIEIVVAIEAGIPEGLDKPEGEWTLEELIKCGGVLNQIKTKGDDSAS